MKRSRRPVPDVTKRGEKMLAFMVDQEAIDWVKALAEANGLSRLETTRRLYYIGMLVMKNDFKLLNELVGFDEGKLGWVKRRWWRFW